MKKTAPATQGKPAGKDKKKLTPAEQAKLEEELKARQQKRAEEDKKYGIRYLIDGMPSLLTLDFLESAWNSERPREFVYDYFTHQLERTGLLYQIKPEEQKMYSNQVLLDLIFLKKELNVEGEKLLLLSNLLFTNFTNKDSRFEIELPQVRESVPETEEEEEALIQEEQKFRAKLPPLEDFEEPDDYRSQLDCTNQIKEKSYESDLVTFKQKLGSLMKKYPHYFMERSEITSLVNHAMSNYFANFNLYKCITLFKKSEENISMQISIDEPTIVLPLTQAEQIGRLDEEGHKDQHDPSEDQEEKKKREEAAAQAAELQRIEEEQKKKMEEWMGLDDRTIAMIQERLAKTKEYMVKRIESKKEEYTEKLAAAKIAPKKK